MTCMNRFTEDSVLFNSNEPHNYVYTGMFGNKIDIKLCNSKKGQQHFTFLNYAAMHINATLRYHSSGMIIHMESDASYLLVIIFRSIVSIQHYLSS